MQRARSRDRKGARAPFFHASRQSHVHRTQGLWLPHLRRSRWLFWEKNVAPYSERWPEEFPRKLIRERCLDALGAPATNEKQALAYCYRRQDEVGRQIDGLRKGPRQLAPDDVEALARAWPPEQRNPAEEVPLHTLDTASLERLRVLLPSFEAEKCRSDKDLLDDPHYEELLDARADQLDQVGSAFEEALQARGLKLAPETLIATKAAYATALARWAEKARDAQEAGAVKAPAAKGTTHPTISADELVEMSLEEGWQGASTIPNVRKAMRKLMNWAKREEGIEYPASLKVSIWRNSRGSSDVTNQRWRA